MKVHILLGQKPPMEKEEEEHYPCLFLDNVEGSIPDSGTALVKYRVRGIRKEPQSGKSSYELDILSFDVKKKLAKDFSRLTGENLDAEDEEEEEEEEE